MTPVLHDRIIYLPFALEKDTVFIILGLKDACTLLWREATSLSFKAIKNPTFCSEGRKHQSPRLFTLQTFLDIVRKKNQSAHFTHKTSRNVREPSRRKLSPNIVCKFHFLWVAGNIYGIFLLLVLFSWCFECQAIFYRVLDIVNVL